MFKERSIRFKLLLISCAAVVVAVLVMMFIARHAFIENAQFTRGNMEALLLEEAEFELEDIGLKTSQEMTSFFNTIIATTNVLATQIENTALGNGGTPFSRHQIKKLNEDAMRSNTDVSAIYSVFESNSYDRQDSVHAGNDAHSTSTGTLAIYFELDEAGDYVYYASEDEEKQDTTKDENGIRASEWYLCPAETKKACLLDPYVYEGQLMTTFTTPILVQDKFSGVVAVDIVLPLIQEKVTQMVKSLYHGLGHVSIVSQRQLLVASSVHPDKLGQSVNAVDATLGQVVTQEGLVKNDDSWYYVKKVHLNKADLPWTVIVSVPKAEILAPAVVLRGQLDTRMTVSLSRLALGGGVIALIGVLVMLTLTQSVTNPIRTIADRMDELATQDGDLTQSLDVNTHAELINLASGFNLFAGKLRHMILDMQQQTQILLDSSQEVSQKISDVNRAAQNQFSHVDNVAHSTRDVSQTTYEVSELANKTASSSSEATENLEKSQMSLHQNKDHVGKLSSMLDDAMSEVGKVVSRSKDIHGILLTIRSIAEQTNLLALNAAIEAARAGEQGRGFAVVADEVRNLAARTQESTEEVDRLVTGLQSDVNSAVKQLETSQGEMKHTLTITEESVENLDIVATRVKQIHSYAREVSFAVDAQKNTSESMSKNTTEIGEESKALSELAQKTEAVMQQAHEAARALSEQLKSFKV